MVFRIRDYPSAESRSSSQILIFYILKHSVGRQDASAIGYSTLTAVVMLVSTGNGTLSADRVFPHLDGVLCRPTECLSRLDRALRCATRCLLIQHRVLCRPPEYFRNWMKHPDGRHSICFYKIKHYDGRQSVSAIGRSTLTADTMLATSDITL